jgi:hypothetical protein
VSEAGDVNGDGVGDLIVGAQYGDPGVNNGGMLSEDASVTARGTGNCLPRPRGHG